MAEKPTECSSVPVIDISQLSDPTKRSSICAQLARACETVGFFEVINSGIPPKIVDEAFDASRAFFDLPKEEKLKLVPDLGAKQPSVPFFQLGYKGFPRFNGVVNQGEHLKFRHYHLQETDSLEEIERKDSNASSGDIDPTQNCWPKNPADYRAKVERLSAEFGKLVDTLLDIFSESLGLPPTFLREEHHTNAKVPRYMTNHHYLKGTKSEEDEVGIVAHRDSSIFTIVAQGYDTNGLDINPYGEWIPLLPQRRGFIVNVGDILQAWTNGKYRSILHRVNTNKEADRYSFAYFLIPAPGPEKDYIVQPIPALVSKESPPTYVPFSYHDFFKSKIMGRNQSTFLKSHQVVVST